MQPDDLSPALAALAAEFRDPGGTDNWRCWAGQNGTLYAWRLLSSPPVVLRDRTLSGLRARMAEFSRVLAETRETGAALAAAERLETT